MNTNRTSHTVHPSHTPSSQTQEVQMNTTNAQPVRAASLKLALVTPMIAAFLMACGTTPIAPTDNTGTPAATGGTSSTAGSEVNTYLKSLPAWTKFSPPASKGIANLVDLPDLPIFTAPIVLPVNPVVLPINPAKPILNAPAINKQALGDSILVSPVLPINREIQYYKPQKSSWNQSFEGVEYDCISTPYSITETPDKVVTLSPDVKALWPGSLLQGQGYVNGIGSLMELPIRERSPLKLSLSLSFAGNTRTVNNPDLASVQQATGEMIQEAKAKGVALGGAISFSQTTAHSTEQSLLEAGLSARYIASSIKANLKVSKDIVENSVTATFFQNAFSISMVTPQTPAEFFSSSFTPEKLDQQVKLGRMGPANLPVYISTVNYGRTLIFNMTSRASMSEIQGALNAVYNGGAVSAGVNLNASQKKILQEAKIKFVAFGGNQEASEALIRSGNLASYFNSSTTADVFRPISYEVRNLGDDSIAKVSETTTYNIRECKARPPAAPEFVKVGERIKITVNNVKILDDGEDGDGGQMIGDLYLNGRSIWSSTKKFPQQVQSGNFMVFPYASDERDFRNGPGGTFRIQGAIDDYDSSSPNDLVGRYDIQLPYPMQYGTFTKRSDPNPSDGESELTYTIEKMNDITEQKK
jgi:Thiol-activated cytolysin